jgi:hypothetical protein
MNSLFAIILGAAFPLVLVITFLKGIQQSTLSDSLKRKYGRRLIITTTVWAISIWTLAFVGVFEFHQGDIAPRFLIGLALPVVMGLSLLRNCNFVNVLDHTPQYLIVGVQTLRVLGISFLFIAQQGIGPKAFAGAGYGDLITGILAFAGGAMLLYGNSKANWVVWAFNIVGLFDLVNVSRILLTYYPGWYQLEPSTAVAGEFPTVLILCLAAPVALLLHVYSLRALFQSQSSQGNIQTSPGGQH